MKRKDLKVPFRQQDLLSLDGFIDYCKKNRVLTSRKELEYFDQSNLLIPAAIVNHGINEFKKVLGLFNGKQQWKFVPSENLQKELYDSIDEPSYYHYGGLSSGSKNWLDFYKDNEMIVSTSAFQSWDSFKAKSVTFTTDPQSARMFSFFYSKLQIYPLKFLKKSRSISVENRALFDHPSKWVKKGESISSYFKNNYSTAFLQKIVSQYNDFFVFFNKVLSVFEKDAIKASEELDRFYNDRLPSNKKLTTLDKSKAYKEAFSDLKHSRNVGDIANKPLLKEIYEEHSFSKKDIENWRHRIMRDGSISGMHFNKEYIKDIKEETLTTSENTYCYVMLLSKVLEAIGCSAQTVKQLLLSSRLPLCPFCHIPVNTTRKKWQTCGAEACKLERKSYVKRKKRKSGEYLT